MTTSLYHTTSIMTTQTSHPMHQQNQSCHKPQPYQRPCMFPLSQQPHQPRLPRYSMPHCCPPSLEAYLDCSQPCIDIKLFDSSYLCLGRTAGWNSLPYLPHHDFIEFITTILMTVYALDASLEDILVADRIEAALTDDGNDRCMHYGHNNHNFH